MGLSEEDKTLSNAEIKSDEQFLGWVGYFQMMSEEKFLRQIGCFRWCSSLCYSVSSSMFFLNISRSTFLEASLYYIVLLHSVLPSTCLLSNPVLKFFSPFPLLFDFLGVKVVVDTVQRSSPH